MKAQRFGALWLLAGVAGTTSGALAQELASVVAEASATPRGSGFDAVVQAVRQSVVASRFPGTVVELDVHAGC